MIIIATVVGGTSYYGKYYNNKQLSKPQESPKQQPILNKKN